MFKVVLCLPFSKCIRDKILCVDLLDTQIQVHNRVDGEMMDKLYYIYGIHFLFLSTIYSFSIDDWLIGILLQFNDIQMNLSPRNYHTKHRMSLKQNI